MFMVQDFKTGNKTTSLISISSARNQGIRILFFSLVSSQSPRRVERCAKANIAVKQIHVNQTMEAYCTVLFVKPGRGFCKYQCSFKRTMKDRMWCDYHHFCIMFCVVNNGSGEEGPDCSISLSNTLRDNQEQTPSYDLRSLTFFL